MAEEDDPIVLELAPPPRERVGPFLLLGLEKDADAQEIEAHWAQRVIWARKGQVDVPLENINWAREIINDAEKRLQADVTSLNLDLTDRVLARLENAYSGAGAVTWQPLDREKPHDWSETRVDLPDAARIRKDIVVPAPREEFPAVPRLLAEMLREPIDPWRLPFDSAAPQDSTS
jgi:hypothetical protein